MNVGSNDLWQELSALADAFGDLGRGLLSASRRLQIPGALPPASLVETIDDLRRRFDGLKERSCRRADALGVAIPAVDELSSLKGLAALLDVVSAAEATRDRQAALAARALALLDRVARLEHTQDPAFPPLADCQGRARTLREAIIIGPFEPVAGEVNSLAESDHPFAHLLTLIDGVEAISDDHWQRLFEAVGGAFGRLLSAAVARGKIVAGNATAERQAPAAAVVARAEAAPDAAASVQLIWGRGGPTPWSPSPEWAALYDAAIAPDDLSETVSFPQGGGGDSTHDRRLGRAPRRNVAPRLERLEPVRLLATNIISGFVFNDANDDGLFEKGETPIAADTIQLVNTAGTVVGTATTDANGAYSFSTDDTVSTAPMTMTQTVTVPETLTNFNKPLSLPQFDPTLGTLTEVDVTVNGTLTSDIAAENTSVSAPATIDSVISGTLSLTAPGGINLSAPLNSPGASFDASAFDGTLDYSGTSGHDFGAQSAAVSKTLTLTQSAGDDLTPFVGTGTLAADLAAQSTSTASGGGNLMAMASSTATATVSITYHYLLNNALEPGNYEIVQATEPPGTLNGLFSRNGTVLPFNNGPGPDTIPITVPVTPQGVTLPNNDFGELTPASISGFVYNDVNKDGLREANEPGFVGIPVALSGTNDLGQSVTLSTETVTDGAYDFTGLRPGTYTLSEPTAPPGFTNGLATEGDVTPIPGSDTTAAIPGLNLTPGATLPNNDFGKLAPASPGGQTIGGGPTPTPTPTPIPVPPSGVTNVYRLGIHHQPTSFAIRFNGALDPVSASDTANYRLVVAFRNGSFGRHAIPIVSAVYDPTADTVTLTPSPAHLNIHYHYQLTITGVKNPEGELIVGSDGTPGDPYVTVITRANDPYPIPTTPKPHAAALARWAQNHPRLAVEWTIKHTPGIPPS